VDIKSIKEEVAQKTIKNIALLEKFEKVIAKKEAPPVEFPKQKASLFLKQTFFRKSC